MMKKDILLLWPVRTNDLVLTLADFSARQLVDPRRVPLRTMGEYGDEYGGFQVECWLFALNQDLYRYLPGDNNTPLVTRYRQPNPKWLMKAKHYLSDLEGTVCVSWINHQIRGPFMLSFFDQPLSVDRVFEL